METPKIFHNRIRGAPSEEILAQEEISILDSLQDEEIRKVQWLVRAVSASLPQCLTLNTALLAVELVLNGVV